MRGLLLLALFTPVFVYGGLVEEWNIKSDAQLWAYKSVTDVNMNSIVNPGNRIADIPSTTSTLDGRLDFRGKSGSIEFQIDPRILVQHTNNGADINSVGLSQGFVRYKAATSALTIGREALTWGPANFRSPSNPFYFDTGRANPLSNTPGIDLVRYTTAIPLGMRVTLGYVTSTSQIEPTLNLGKSGLLKIDQQGTDYLISLIATEHPNSDPFVGAFGQYVPTDAWLLYTEVGSSQQAHKLNANIQTNGLATYSVQLPGPRKNSQLLGISYTLVNDQTLTAEYLHYANGFNSVEMHTYWTAASQANAVANYASLGQAISMAPPLMSKNYLWIAWQSSAQNQNNIWRLTWARNMQDLSGQALIYFEHSFATRVSGFIVTAANFGGKNTEYGALIRDSITLGLKFYLP